MYNFEGTVMEHTSTNSDGYLFEQIIVETDGGSVMIMNFYKALYNKAIKELGEVATKAEMPYAVDDFCFPSDGETAQFIGIYHGYSNVAQMPVFYLGANPVLFEMLDYPDPAESAAACPVCRIDGDTITVGNLQFHKLDGYSAAELNENTVMLGSESGDCAIAIFAADISEIDEATAKQYLPMQSESFQEDDAVQSDAESIGNYSVGGFDVEMMYYTEIFPDLAMQGIVDTTFTDSWYSYTILLRTTDAGNMDYVTAYGEMLLLAQYIGPEPRFDFVQ